MKNKAILSRDGSQLQAELHTRFMIILLSASRRTWIDSIRNKVLNNLNNENMPENGRPSSSSICAGVYKESSEESFIRNKEHAQKDKLRYQVRDFCVEETLQYLL